MAIIGGIPYFQTNPFPKNVLRMAAAMAVYYTLLLRADRAFFYPGAQSHCLATSTTWRPGADYTACYEHAMAIGAQFML